MGRFAVCTHTCNGGPRCRNNVRDAGPATGRAPASSSPAPVTAPRRIERPSRVGFRSPKTAAMCFETSG